MKVLMLDVDFVLNDIHTKTTHISEGGIYPGVDKEKIQLLKQIIYLTGAKIVLSSTWRKYREDREYLFKEMGKKLSAEVIGQTDDFELKCRADEIDAWIGTHTDITQFVVLDDAQNDDLIRFGGSWVRTYMTDGLTPELAQKCIEKLQ